MKILSLLTSMYSVTLLSLTNKNSVTISNYMLMNNKNFLISVMSLMVMWMIFNMNNKNFYSKINDKMSENMIYAFMGFMSITVFTSNNTMMFFILFEATVIPMMLVMVNFSKEKEKIKSMFFMMVTNMMFSLPFMMYFIYSKESLQSSNMEFMMGQINSWMSMNISMMMCLMLLTKYPMFLTHMWLPKAHVEASTCGSMILAGILLKLGTMGLEKNIMMMEKSIKTINMIIKNISLTGMMMTSVMMLRSTDLKKMSAIFSISHMSMVLINTSFCKELSMEQSKMMMISHGIISAIMFMLIGLMYENKNSRSILISKNMESFNKQISTVWLITMFMNIGIPPMMNVLSEMMMLVTMLKENIYSSISLSMYMIISMMINMMMLTKNIMKKEQKSYSNKKMMMSNPISFVSMSCISLTILNPLF